MKRKQIGFIILTLLINTNIPMVIQANENFNLLDGGWIEEIDGVTILHVNGTHYEMGYQHGFLMKDEVLENMNAFMEYAEKHTTFKNLLEMWTKCEPFVPQCYIKEINGIADGAGVSFSQVAALYMLIPFIDMQCFTAAAWGKATENGNLYHIRSLDFPLTIRDPVTGTFIQENSMILVRHPSEGLRSISPSIAGSINFYQGINEALISVGVQVCWSRDQTLEGLPVKFKMLKILDSATTASDAIEILTKNNTLGWNFVLSDGNANVGYVVEITANHSYIGRCDESVEDTPPFWKIENVVRRTNFFIDTNLASTQRVHYDTSGLNSFIRLFFGDPFYPLWRKYRAMSLEIEESLGLIDLNSSMDSLRTVYNGDTDRLLSTFLLLGRNSILCDFHQWVLCLQSGELMISFADKNQYAHETDIHTINIYDLFESKLP